MPGHEIWRLRAGGAPLWASRRWSAAFGPCDVAKSRGWETDAAGPTGQRSRRLGEGLDELAVVELVVQAAPGEELVMRALLDDPAVVHHEDRVRVADRGESVGDHERRAPLHQACHRSLDEHFRPRVD